ncbi:MAG: hypothetical protein RIC85_04090 [Gammaproteobacteria bacterium]
MQFDWSTFITQVVAVIIGGVLVIVSNEFAERRRRISRREELAEHEQAIYTAIHAVRNFIAEAFDDGEDSDVIENPSSVDWNALKSAQAHLHRLIDKSQPVSQSLLHIVFDLSLRLDDLVSHLESDYDEEEDSIFLQGLAKKANAVLSTLETFELISAHSLTFLTEDDLQAFDKMPKDIVAIKTKHEL